MQHFFSYYSEGQSVTVPDQNCIGLFGPIAVPPHDREQILNDAFAHPLNSAPLRELATPEDTVLIVVDDPLLPTPVVFPFFHVIGELHKAGVKDANIRVLVANEMCRASTSAEIDRLIGAEMHTKYQVFQAFGNDKDQHVFGVVNAPSGAVALSAHHLLHEASLIVSISGVYPDRFLGFTGSGSAIFPGLAGERATAAIVNAAAAQPAESVYGKVTTPAREVINLFKEFIPSFKFSVDVVLDRKQQISACIAGNPLSAYHVAADSGFRISSVEIPEKADIVVLDSNPFDHSLLQAMRAAYASLGMLKDRNSELIIVTPLYESLPPQIAALSVHTSETRRHIIDESHKAPLSHHPMWGAELVAMAEVLERTSITTIVSTGHGREDVTKFGFGLRSKVQDALNESMGRFGASARVAVVTQGGLVAQR